MDAMEKAKNIITSGRFVRTVLWIAGIVAAIAVVVVLWAVLRGRSPVGETGTADFVTETVQPVDNKTTVINVVAGDTLSKILSANGVGGTDINSIAGVLKAKAGITGLRADKDKIEIVRDAGPDTPITKIVVLPGPWRRVELTCDVNFCFWDWKNYFKQNSS